MEFVFIIFKGNDVLRNSDIVICSTIGDKANIFPVTGYPVHTNWLVYGIPFIAIAVS